MVARKYNISLQECVVWAAVPEDKQNTQKHHQLLSYALNINISNEIHIYGAPWIVGHSFFLLNIPIK